MSAVYLLIPVALVLVSIIIYIFFWAVRNDQFGDLEGPAHRILFDDDSPEVAGGTETTGDDSGNTVAGAADQRSGNAGPTGT